MSMKDWAEQEVNLAMQKMKAKYNEESFDYIRNCYNSALKAYNTLMDDEHSGGSFGIARCVLVDLLYERPLSPITEDDFIGIEPVITPDNGVIKTQCPRMYSLFQYKYKDGTVKYSDIDRVYCLDIHNTTNQFTCKMARDIVNEMFPITMPYSAETGKYKIYTETFLFDKDNGDYDTQAYLYMVTPDNKKIELNILTAEKNNKFVEITSQEYEKRKQIFKKKE